MAQKHCSTNHTIQKYFVSQNATKVGQLSQHKCTYTVSQKNQDTRLLSVTVPKVNRFSKFCTDKFICKFAIYLLLNILSHLKGIATIPCEILRSENSDSLKHVF